MKERNRVKGKNMNGKCTDHLSQTKHRHISVWTVLKNPFIGDLFSNMSRLQHSPESNQIPQDCEENRRHLRFLVQGPF